MGTAPGTGPGDGRGRRGAEPIGDTVAGGPPCSNLARQTVALLCPEPRLRRILRLALQADGYDVVEWTVGGSRSAVPAAAVVADLDGLHSRPSEAIATLRSKGIDDATALLLISVYPPEPDDLERAGPLEYLQPPFAPREFSGCVGRLLRSGGPRASHDGVALHDGSAYRTAHDPAASQG